MYASRITHLSKHRQRGAAFIVMLVIMIMGVAAFLVSSLNSSAVQIRRDQVNTEVMAQAKEALIGYAASVNLTTGSKRPGDLPCPDTNNDGIAELSCGNASGTTGQALRIGRLPWLTLGLPDLRDSSGERLWYAVSNNFKNNTKTTCSAAGQPGCLNSDSAGTITVRSPNGNILFDASLGNGVVAIIISPGDVLQRTDQPAPQDRSSGGINNPQNYLDIALGEDNATFVDGATDGFIQGRVKDINGNVILNDQMIVITQDNIMQALQKRVAGEVRQCLSEYANPANSGIGLYPWAAPTIGPSYIDTSGTLFGRIPDTPFGDTLGDNGSMNNTWVGNCNILSSSGWWLNWKEQVFFGMSDYYSPDQNTGAPLLTVTPPSLVANKQFVVIVAGKMLPGQVRSLNSDKSIPNNYLEGQNSVMGTTLFIQSSPSATFNDTVGFQ